MRPLLPPLSASEPYLKRIDAERWYTNYGPLTRAFEERLAGHFGVEPARIVTVANGTIALLQALRAFEAKPGSLCAMPSWTFVATAAAAEVAGLVPFFVDVERTSWRITPERVEEAAAGREIGAVIAVAPFGAPIDVAAWTAYSRRTSTPVLLDCAAGFDTFAATDGCNLEGATAMISFHATKVFGVGEGACLIAETAEFGHRLRLHGNFGFYHSRDAQLPGLNSKLSEYAAAIGLAAFDLWDKSRRNWVELRDAHAAMLRDAGGLQATPDFLNGWVSCYGLVEMPAGRSVDDAAAFFRARGIETRAWWARGCHEQPAYRGCPRENDLPNTCDLARRVLGLPFWRELGPAEFERIGQALRAFLLQR